MARPFSSRDAQKLIDRHNSILHNLDAIPEYIAELAQEIRTASDELAAQELLNVLRSIPIEEINCEKRGFRVSALKNSGYTPIADIAFKSESALESIYGIGNSAWDIVRTVQKIVSAAKEDIKIRLSSDEKTAYSSRLVTALSSYRQVTEVSERQHTLPAVNDYNWLGDIQHFHRR